MKRNIQKLFALMLALALILSTAACSSNEVAGDTIPPQQTAAQPETAAPTEGVVPADCAHERHDRETTRCLVCDKRIQHNYVDDICTLCGKKLVASIGDSPELWSILKDGGHENKGTIERMTYETFAYNLNALTGEETYIEKEAYVYLPYGYDASKQYDMLILLHGSSDDAGYWLAQGSYTPEDSTYRPIENYAKELLDYMIGEGLSKECIVVTPSLYNDHDHYEDENRVGADLFGHEIVEYLLPEVIANYSTYASTMEDVIENRDHFAYAGLSMGSRTSFNSILSYCLPYFSYIGSFGGGAGNIEAVAEALNGEYKDYAINYWCCAVGEKDRTGGSMFDSVHNSYAELVARVDRLTDGENCILVDVIGAEHTFDCWLTCLYQALPTFFK